MSKLTITYMLLPLMLVLGWINVGVCELHSRLVKATAYCTGTKCAWGDKPEVGIIAVSRDLERKGLDYGTLVYIGGEVYVVKDRMPWQKNHVDIYMHNRRKARKFGKKRIKIFWHGKRRCSNGGRRRPH